MSVPSRLPFPLPSLTKAGEESRPALRVLILGCLLVLLLAGAQSERLPIRVYTSADGLARDTVLCVKADSRGYIWFGTVEGVSRFDGYQFRNYGMDRGLPYPVIVAFLETRNGSYWVGTRGNVCKFNPKPEPGPGGGKSSNFTCFPLGGRATTSFATVLKEDKSGAIWCGTEMGLYRLEEQNGSWALRFVDIGLPIERQEGAQVNDLLEDDDGSLWVAVESGLYCRRRDGSTIRFSSREGLPIDAVSSLLRDKKGVLWAGTARGVCELVEAPEANRPVVARKFTTYDGLGGNYVTKLFQSTDGRLWVGTRLGLNELWHDNAGLPHFHSLNATQGLPKFAINAIAEDRFGNIWMGGETSGAIKMVSGGFVTWRATDGLGESQIESIFETREGALTVVNASTTGSG